MTNWFALQIRQNPAPAGFPKSKSGTALEWSEFGFQLAQSCYPVAHSWDSNSQHIDCKSDSANPQL